MTTQSIAWTDSALPVGLTIDQLLYRVRRHDEGGLIFDSVTLDELLEESEAQLALDAMVTPYNKLARKASALQAIMTRAVPELQVVAMQVSDPFKQNGTANVVVLFELSDGQTVSVYFHNPDATPGKILPTDELVSWKWLLNKKDITIVVAPERGNDLAVREVGRRIMKLAAKNSAAFARVNGQRAARLQNIASMRSEIGQLETELNGLLKEIEVAELEAENRALAESQKPTAEKGLTALNSVRQFLSRGQFKTIANAMKGEEGRFFIDKAVVLAQLIDGMAKTYEQDGKDDPTAYLHYFKGSADWHITEKDASGKGTEQAFGLADLGHGGELGYISIDELVRNNAELDLHFEPRPLSAVRRAAPEQQPDEDGERIQRLLSMLNGARDQLATMQSGSAFYGNLQRDIADMASQLWRLGYRGPEAAGGEEQDQLAPGAVEHEQPALPDTAWLEAAELFGKGMPGFAGAHATGDRAEIALAGAQAGSWVLAADLKAGAFRDAEGKTQHGPTAESPAEAFAALQAMPEWAALQASGEAGQLVPEGKENVVKTAKGTKIATGFTVVEADQLIASHDINGNVNPDYPQLFQPRDRSRDSSIAWVKKTASQLDPDSLGRTSRADSGAPIVGKDRVVESGNGRTMALQEAYRSGTAEEYREWLIGEAEYFGLNPERVRAMKAPVLVRVRTTDIDRRVFAIEANQDDKLTMTGSEKARADADRLDMALLARLSDDGNLLAAANRDFVTGFLRSLGDTEAAQYMTGNGQPTGALIARIQAAIFAKAYSDDRLLELTADASRPEVANILEALNVSAPEFILAQAADAAGTQALTGKLVDSVETSLNQQAVDAIIQATNLVRKVRAEGGSVEEAINQLGLFGDIPPATAAMALFISKNNRSSKRLGIAFKAMAEFVRTEAERGQTVDMFGESQQASLQQILEAANRKLDQEYGEGAFAIEAGDLFAQPEPEPEPEQAESEPAAEPEPTAEPQEPAIPTFEQYVLGVQTKQRAYIAEQRTRMEAIARGELDEKQLSLPASQRMTPEDAKARLAELDEMEARIPEQYSVESETMRDAYEDKYGVAAEPQQADSAPAPVDPAADSAAATRALFQAVIDGDVSTVAPELEDGMLDAGLVQKLQDAYGQVAGDAELDALFERAVDALTEVMLKATEGVQ